MSYDNGLYVPYDDLRFNTFTQQLEYNSGNQVWLPVPPGGTAPSSANVPLTVVLRDASGNFSAGTITAKMKGTTTNDNAPAGDIGEYVASVATSVLLPTGSYSDVTSIALTAGDWDVSVMATLHPNDSIISDYIIGASVTSGNSGAGLVEAVSKITGGADGTIQIGVSLPAIRFSLAAPATVYLKEFIDWTTGGGPSIVGGLTARRVR